MDSVFAQYLSEIQKSYLALPKAARIRVERWLEKLVSTGNNPVWRKHRNEYAKLLLNMVNARNLEAPFNAMPLDGPLPPFASQYKLHNRHLLGAHETTFWRELYQQFQHDTEVPGHSVGDSSFAYGEEKTDRFGAAMHEKLFKASSVAPTASNNVVLSKEIQSLNLLIREQSQRIKLLEQQLHDERTQHELQLQRLNYSHRVEVNGLKSQIDSFAMEMSVQALSPTRREVKSYLNESTHLEPPASPTTRHFPMRMNASFHRSPDASPRPGSGSSASEGFGKRGLLSFLEQKNNVTSALNNLSHADSIGTNVFDLTPRPKSTQHTTNASAHYETRSPDRHASAEPANQTPTAHTHVNDSRFDDSGLNASLRWGSNQYRSAVGDAEDEAFLAHIDRFQSEIKKINTNITLTSPERF